MGRFGAAGQCGLAKQEERGGDIERDATMSSLTILIAWDVEMLERGANVVSTMTPTEWMEATE
ncbi:MAG TPA: hypothetical protein ENJ31_07370 [Anaerolineae bacterium]|nr:hypothetical protein [Anaerolineae bacterium]